MVILKNGDKEFKLVPRTRKVIDLTDKLKVENLNEVIFSGLRQGNIKTLAELIYSFAEDETEKKFFSSINEVYDYIDAWQLENKKSYAELYKVVAEVVNEMGFFKNKMTPEELTKELTNPSIDIDIQTMAMNSAQKIMDSMAEEEFRGHLG